MNCLKINELASFCTPLKTTCLYCYPNYICLYWRGSEASRVRIPPEHGYLCLVSVVFCPVEVFASGWSLVQRSPTECGASECNRKASIMRRPWPTRGRCAIKRPFAHVLYSVWWYSNKWISFSQSVRCFVQLAVLASLSAEVWELMSITWSNNRE